MIAGRTTVSLLALALAGGLIDAASYLGLGHVFTANMTGNTVLLAVAVAKGSGADAARAGTALAGFCAGVAAGAALLRDGRDWPGSAAWCLTGETIGLTALLVVWAVIGAAPVRYALIAVSGAVMGAQSASVRASDLRGVSTTYVTGTLTNAIARLVQRARSPSAHPPGPALPGATWAIYGAGALIGALAESSWRAAVIALPLALVAAVTLAAGRHANKEER